jgi:hypothetical protein
MSDSHHMTVTIGEISILDAPNTIDWLRREVRTERANASRYRVALMEIKRQLDETCGRSTSNAYNVIDAALRG